MYLLTHSRECLCRATLPLVAPATTEPAPRLSVALPQPRPRTAVTRPLALLLQCQAWPLLPSRVAGGGSGVGRCRSRSPTGAAHRGGSPGAAGGSSSLAHWCAGCARCSSRCHRYHGCHHRQRCRYHCDRPSCRLSDVRRAGRAGPGDPTMSPPVSAKDKVLTAVYIALWFIANGTWTAKTSFFLLRGWGVSVEVDVWRAATSGRVGFSDGWEAMMCLWTRRPSTQLGGLSAHAVGWGRGERHEGREACPSLLGGVGGMGIPSSEAFPSRAILRGSKGHWLTSYVCAALLCIFCFCAYTSVRDGLLMDAPVRRHHFGQQVHFSTRLYAPPLADAGAHVYAIGAGGADH